MSIRFRELTPPGLGGIRLLAVEGRGAHEHLARHWPAIGRIAVGGLGLCPLGEVAARGAAGDADALLDEALVHVAAPDRVELSLHGASAVVRAVQRALARLDGFVAADEGAAAAGGGADEAPTQRSIEERARTALARAASDREARVLLDQVEGALWRELGRLVSASEPDFTRHLAVLERRAALFERLARPAVVVLAGPTNAGKSTLFNALCGRERVVVAAEPGTTRDLVVERVHLGAWPVDLVDTAGERELLVGASREGRAALARDAVECAGQELGRALRARADMVLWLEPATDVACDPASGRLGPDAQRGPRVLAVTSRADEPRPDAAGSESARARGGKRAGAEAGAAKGAVDRGAPRPALSALERPSEAVELVRALFHEALDLPREPWEPGAGVPFDEPQRAWLLALGRMPAGERQQRFAALIAGDARSAGAE